MSFLNSLNISGSGLTAQRLRMDVISENIANIDTTRTENGGAYRRKMVVLSSTTDFKNMLVQNLNDYEAGGVEVTDIIEDQSEFKLVYNPEHPDADENGYVSMPNVDSLKETVDMMEAYRAYQANITALNTTKQMAVKALEIGEVIMYIKPIQQIQGLNQLDQLNKSSNENKNEISFKSMFNEALGNYVEAEAKVDEDIYKLSVGESDDLHNLMINTQQAELSLDLMIQLRNKALDAYNEIMRMGV